MIRSLFSIATMLVVGFLAFTFFNSMSLPGDPEKPAAPVQLAADQSAELGWTAKDTARCQSAARKANSAPVPIDAALANRAVTDGYAGMATFLECRLTVRVERFCDPKGKAALVASINDYVGRGDWIRLGLGLQGAPMAVMGAIFGGEMAAGSGIYNLERDATFAFMKVYDDKIAQSLKLLGRKGVVTAADFATFFGMGVPSAIAKTFEGVVADRSICA